MTQSATKNILLIEDEGEMSVAAGDFALEVGADIFLPKPFTKLQLLHSVNALLN